MSLDIKKTGIEKYRFFYIFKICTWVKCSTLLIPEVNNDLLSCAVDDTAFG